MIKKIDLRSDTVTKPGDEMLAYMMKAEVADDVYGEDPTVNALQQQCTTLFGKEAALFCPSGTMTNQIAIKVHTHPGDELICSDNAHVYKYEGGGIAFNSGVQAKALLSDRGKINASQIKNAINAKDVHFPVTRLVCLENTSNRGGGAIYEWNEMEDISHVCRENGLALHLDGARVFNALAERSYTAKQIGTLFNSISICFSKSLGCPVGSVLLGDHSFIEQAKRVRKVLGGGMRQAGYLAAAAIYALQNNVERLKYDHAHAGKIRDDLKNKNVIKEILPVETNILIFTFHLPGEANRFKEHMLNKNILCNLISADSIRFVFHLDITPAMVKEISEAIASF